MSDFSPINDYTAKGLLTTGDPDRLILGADFDAEFAAIATSIATKYDSTNLASQTEAEEGTVNITLMTPLRREQHITAWAAETTDLVSDLHSLADPNADSLLFWDNVTVGGGAAGAFATPDTGLAISGTNITLDINSLGAITSFEDGADKLAVYDASGAVHLGLTLGDDAIQSNLVRVAYKTTNETVTSSASIQADDELYINDLPAGTWTWFCWLKYAGDTTADLKAYVADTYQKGVGFAVEHSGSDMEYRPTDSVTGEQYDIATGFGYTYAVIRGTRVSGGTTDLQLWWSQNASNSNGTVVYASSYLVAIKVA